jgi:hypothetical protein
LSFSQLGIGSFNLKNCGLPNFSAKKISLLHQEVATLADFCAVMSLHSLVKGKAVFSDATFLTFSMGKPACSIAESIRLVGRGFFSQYVLTFWLNSALVVLKSADAHGKTSG